MVGIGIGIHVGGIEELLAERGEALEALAGVRSRRQLAGEQIHRLTAEVREKKSQTTSASQERDKLLADGSPEAQIRLRELRTQIGSAASDLAGVQEELLAARRFFDVVRNDAERAADRLGNAASQIYTVMHRVFVAEAIKRIGPELFKAISALRYVLREESPIFPVLSDAEIQGVLIALKVEYFGDPPPASVPVQDVPTAAAPAPDVTAPEAPKRGRPRVAHVAHKGAAA